jgi:hypothetical protein
MIETLRVFDVASGCAKDFTFRDNQIVHEELLTPEDMDNEEDDGNGNTGDYADEE